MKKLQFEYANLYKSLCLSYGIKNHNELKDAKLTSFSSELKQKWQSIVASKKEKKKSQYLTIVMLQSWQRRLQAVLNTLYEQNIIGYYDGDVGPTELVAVVNTKLDKNELLDLLREKLDFSGYLDVHTSTKSELEIIER